MPACLRDRALPAVIAASVTCAAALPAGAQTPPGPVEVFVSLNAGLTRPATATLSRSTVVVDPPDRDEIKTDMPAGTGPGFDLGGGLLVRRRFFVGVATSRYVDSQSGTLGITADHPLFHPTLTASAETGELKRSESRVDLEFGYVLPRTGRFQLLLFGGPSRFTVSQDMVADFRISEAFDPSTRSFRLVGPSSFEIAKEKASGWGYNAGVDAGYMLTRHVGVGALVRYSRATLDLRDPLESAVEDRTVTKEFDAGGLQVSGGLRLRF
jgi:opacity protein-like surface antigen